MKCDSEEGEKCSYDCVKPSQLAAAVDLDLLELEHVDAGVWADLADGQRETSNRCEGSQFSLKLLPVLYRTS